MNRSAIIVGALGMTLGVMAHGRSAAGEALDSQEAPSPALGWSTTYASRYSFQGLDYSVGRPVFQPSATAGLRGFTAGLWGNVDQTRNELDEVDATLQREFERGSLSGALGYAYLHYPNREEWAPTHETYLDLSFAAPLDPSLSVHWDVDAGAGRYWTLGIGNTFESAPGSLELSAKLYAHEHYYGMSGIPAFETGVAFSRDWGPLAVQPAIARQWAWENGDFRDDLAIQPGWVATLSVSPK